MTEFATEKDIRELFELQLLAFESEAEMIGSRNIPALMESYEENAADFKNWKVIVTRNSDGRIIAAARYKDAGEFVELGRIMVHPDYRRQGLAINLIGQLEQESGARAFELYTCTKSYINIRLYEKLGYRTYKIEKGEKDLSFAYMRKEI